MKKNLWFFAAAALALVSCDEEALVNSPADQSNKVLTVSFEQEASSTRVNIAADNGLSWSFGDAIAVFDENESSYKYNYIGRVTDNFQVEDDNNVPQNIVGAAFPHSKDVSLDNDILTMNLPSSYDQTTLGELDMPLWGRINGNNITLKHLAGALKVNLIEVPEGYNTLIVTASEPISGTFTADITKKNPVLTSNLTSDANKEVRVHFTKGNNISLFLPLPVGTYASIEVRIAGDGKETLVLKRWAGNTVERAKIYTTSEHYYNSENAQNGSGLINALALGEDVILQNDIEINADSYSSEDFYFSKAAHLDLNGYKLTYTGNDVIFRVANGGNIYIDGTKEGSQIITKPTDPSETGANGYVALVQEGGVVIFNGGNYVLENTCTVAQSNGGKVYVQGGTYDAQKVGSSYARGTYTFNIQDSYATNGLINISGGTFKYFDPANNFAENPQISFVMNGYASYKSGENEWTVVPENEIPNN